MWDFTNDIRILSKDLEFDIMEVSPQKSEIALSYCSEASELPRKQNMIEIFDIETSEFKKGKYNILQFSGYGSQYLFPPYVTDADGTRLAFVIQTDYKWPDWYDWIYYLMVWNLVNDSIEYKNTRGTTNCYFERWDKISICFLETLWWIGYEGIYILVQRDNVLVAEKIVVLH